MRNGTSLFDLQARKYADRAFIPHTLGSLIRLVLFIAGLGVAGMVAFVSVLHLAEVIP